MVPKKHKSKRMSGRQKAKIVKRSSEKRRKERKAARLNPTTNKAKKDPGIPNLWPFKDKLMGQIEESKQRAAEEKLRQKSDRSKMHDKNRGLGNTKSLKDLASDAQSRGQVYNDIHGGSLANDGTRVLVDGALSGRRDNSMRAYYREFRKVVDHADVILEVLDARDPLGCRTKSIERLIMSQATNKRIILVLNKIDLVPRENVEAWLKYLRNEFPTIAFKASTQNQRTRLGQANANTANSDQQVQKSECLGADTLIQLLKNYSRNLNIKTSITVGVIGYPNVGKSSLINSLRRARVCQVGSTPGMTKVAQEIHLDKNVKLLDSPGIVFAKPPNADSSNGKVMADVMLRNCIKVDLLEDPIAPVEAIVARCNIRHLMVLYNVPSFEDTRGFLIHLARQRGRLRHGGLPNMDAAARIVLNDWNTGVIQFYTSPPTQTTTAPMQAAEIVQAWGKEFDLNMVQGESDQTALDGLKPTNSFGKQIVNVMFDPSSGNDQLMTEEEIAAIDEANGIDVDSDEFDSDMDGDDMDDSDDGDDDDEAPDAVPMEDDESDAESEVDATQPALHVSAEPRNTKKSSSSTTTTTKTTTRKQVLMTPEEELINPQTRAAQRKLQKKLKKDRRRNEAAQVETLENGDNIMVEEEGGADDDYNFNSYFTKPQTGSSKTSAVAAAMNDDSDSEEDL